MRAPQVPAPMSHQTCNYGCPAGQESWDGFFRGSDPQQAVALSAHELNFGSCSRLSPGGHKTLTVSNATNAKVTAFLVVPAWQGHGSQTHMHQVFQVSMEQTRKEKTTPSGAGSTKSLVTQWTAQIIVSIPDPVTRRKDGTPKNLGITLFGAKSLLVSVTCADHSCLCHVLSCTAVLWACTVSQQCTAQLHKLLSRALLTVSPSHNGLQLTCLMMVYRTVSA